MKTLCIFGTTLFFLAGLCHAETFTGKLMDAGCYNSNKVATQESGHKTYSDITKTCAPTSSSTNFAVRVTGSAYGADAGNTIKLDDSGNAQAASELHNGSLKPDNDGDVHVKVSGNLKGETLTNASVEPERGHGGATETSTTERSR